MLNPKDVDDLETIAQHARSGNVRQICLVAEYNDGTVRTVVKVFREYNTPMAQLAQTVTDFLGGFGTRVSALRNPQTKEQERRIHKS